MKIWTWIAALALLPGCDSSGDDTGSSSSNTAGETGSDTEPTGGGDDTQVPPMGHTAIQTWLAAGHYQQWKCQSGPQPPIGISPHGSQRICSNDLMSAHGDGEYPVNAAAVKELLDDAGDIVGYAVSLHVSAGKTGDNWYWYEIVPPDSMAPHDETTNVVADGIGTMGSAPGQALCVGCHEATGIDAEHPGHDFVYEQVK